MLQQICTTLKQLLLLRDVPQGVCWRADAQQRRRLIPMLCSAAGPAARAGATESCLRAMKAISKTDFSGVAMFRTFLLPGTVNMSIQLLRKRQGCQRSNSQGQAGNLRSTSNHDSAGPANLQNPAAALQHASGESEVQTCSGPG